MSEGRRMERDNTSEMEHAEDKRDVVDINVLNKSIKEIVSRQSELRIQIDRIVANLEGKPE